MGQAAPALVQFTISAPIKQVGIAQRRAPHTPKSGFPTDRFQEICRETAQIRENDKFPPGLGRNQTRIPLISSAAARITWASVSKRAEQEICHKTALIRENRKFPPGLGQNQTRIPVISGVSA